MISLRLFSDDSTGSLLLRHGNAAGGEEGHRMAAKFLVKKSGVAARPSQYYPIELTKKRFNLCCKKIMGGRYFKWSIIRQLRN